jgi:hypothetical protein
MWLRGRESSYIPDMARKRAFRIGRARTGLGLFATAPIKIPVRYESGGQEYESLRARHNQL